MIELEKMMQKNAGLKIPGGISVLQDLEATLPLLSPQTLIAQMDEAGISKSVLYAVDAPIVYASNEYVQSLCAQFPDRLMGFASVNPNGANAVERLDKAINERGLLGLKLHPPLQNFFPNDEAVFPIYEKALELKIPVVFHVGTTPFGSLSRLSQANPLLIDDVSVEFPELRIMLTHLGTLAHKEAFMVVEKNPNVYIDTSAYLYEIKEILTLDLITRLGPNKVIFGTDYPMPYAGVIHQMKDFVECLKNLDLTEDVLEGIFHKNFEIFMNYESTEEDLNLEQIIMNMKK
ncbi:MAG: amidohydrolase family protein [Candidatus Scalindua rubra]|nr:amidohydrolase family protein [Candidatus Scalindua rubra]